MKKMPKHEGYYYKKTQAFLIFKCTIDHHDVLAQMREYRTGIINKNLSIKVFQDSKIPRQSIKNEDEHAQ